MRNFHIVFKQTLNYQIIYNITLADRSARSCILFLFYEYINFLGEEVWQIQIPTLSKSNSKPEIVHCHNLSKFKGLVEV